jgi:hypothetical protein
MRFFIALSFLLIGCGGGVQVIERGAQSGAIAISGSDDTAHSAADRYIKKHCATGYTVTDERPTGNGWRMTYRCNEASKTTDVTSEAILETVTVHY